MSRAAIIGSPYLDAIGIPLVVLFMGAVATKIIRNEEWSTHHWVLGVQVALAAFSVAIINVLDLVRASVAATAPTTSGDFYFVLLISICLIFVAMSQHQDYLRNYPPEVYPRQELPYLDLLRVNAAGFASLGLVIYQLTQ